MLCIPNNVSTVTIDGTVYNRIPCLVVDRCIQCVTRKTAIAQGHWHTSHIAIAEDRKNPEDRKLRSPSQRRTRRPTVRQYAGGLKTDYGARHLRRNPDASRTGESAALRRRLVPNWVTTSNVRGHGGFFFRIARRRPSPRTGPPATAKNGSRVGTVPIHWCFLFSTTPSALGTIVTQGRSRTWYPVTK